MQLPDVEREIIDEVRKLSDDDGGCEDNQSDNADNEQANDGQRRNEPVHSQPLQPGSQGVKQIGQHHTGNER